MENTDIRKLMRLGYVIDGLISRDYTARGISHELYDCAQQKAQASLTMAAATALANRAGRGRPVLIFTGWPCCPWLRQGLTETDGPAGAAVLARCLEETFGMIPILVMERSLMRFGKKALAAAGMIVSDLKTAIRSKDGPLTASVGAVICLSADWETAGRQGVDILETIRPVALLSIELPGANRARQYHDIAGSEIPTDAVIKADEIFRQARERGILTIGIGDGGNELGMANAAHAVEEYLPGGRGILPVTPVDRLVIACVSNWGALGLAACIAALTGRPEVFEHIDMVRVMDSLTAEGAIDGLTAYVDSLNDGAGQEINRSLSRIMAMALHMHMNSWKRPPEPRG